MRVMRRPRRLFSAVTLVGIHLEATRAGRCWASRANQQPEDSHDNRQHDENDEPLERPWHSESKHAVLRSTPIRRRLTCTDLTTVRPNVLRSYNRRSIDHRHSAASSWIIILPPMLAAVLIRTRSATPLRKQPDQRDFKGGFCRCVSTPLGDIAPRDPSEREKPASSRYP
jgi:hypothetical protein